ncbi:RNA polymerase I-specific transcription initiation factor RRN3 [Lentinula raphanica]|uniref:RNA polymerase I-specific transcription initiation factor RRN3 n=1 Tax=Lentinula raphanica TaxID=153919 RepID=A0AA38PF40_9AGAR|nr:RNA polymerase I-specific transcription initiation factor RRN3 [Lentinula raphanica]
MDPHSRFSHFDNKRNPKAGPQSLAQRPRFMDNSVKPNLDNFASMKQQSRKNPGSYDDGSSILARRPFVTNSRVKQEEKSRKDMYLAFVNNALQEKGNGNTEPFEELVSQFNPKRSSTELLSPQPAQLRLWILALSHVVSRLGRAHSSLVEAIINMPWVTMDNATVRSYMVFIGMLISARPEYLSLVLGKLSLGFTHQAGFQALSTSLPETSSTPITRRLVYDRLHQLLRHLLSLIPTLPSTLMPLLSRNFPHKRQNQTAQTTYIRNLLRVTNYCPELADQILGLIVDRAIQIDVEIQIEIDEIEEEAVQEEEDIFELDPFDVLVGQEGDEDDSDQDISDDEFETFSDISSEGGDMDDDGGLAGRIDDLPTKHEHLREMVKKLDAILSLVFEHFEAYASLAKTFDEDEDTLHSPSSSLPELPPLPPISTAVNPFFDATYTSSTTGFTSFSQPPPSNQAQLAQLNLLASSPSRPSTPTSAVLNSPSSLLPNQSSLPPPTKKMLRAQFHTLLSIFDRTILRTFKSRYTQFLLFWYTSLDAEFSDIFQGMLVDRAIFQSGQYESGGGTPGQTPIVTRAAAASYIGSFVSRARFVDREGARRVVGVLCEFLKAHLDGVESILKNTTPSNGSRGANAAVDALNVIGDQNTVFYAVAQAFFLIFCFRWRDLLQEDEEDDLTLLGAKDVKSSRVGKKWMEQLDVVQRVVNSVLNPLKVCSPNVANQFARVAHATDFIYCYTILESNRRSDVSSGDVHQISLSTLTNGLHLTSELNTFFPFDPYKLPKSGAYIQEIYRDWASVAINEDSDDDDDVSDSDGSDEDEDVVDASSEVGMPITISVAGGDTGANGDATAPTLGASFDAMSISPAKEGINAAEHVLAMS